MKSREIRNQFFEYFKNQGHSQISSSRLIPEDDPTLLFTNAGMNQFKNVFLGLESRDFRRAVTSQKCVRAGGKHNDLENVGHTARHHTFFEMLGNFSFGDYFKKEAIHFAWEFITKELQLPKDRLYVSVFKDDDEAAEIWQKQEGVPADRIYRFGEKDNFWRMGDTGPCGPCSEIFYDLGPNVPGDPKQNVMGGEGDRYIEFWNLVFMQFNEDEQGNKTLLPNPSIDTGMGLERLTTILQGKLNNYHTDLFTPLIATVEKLTGHEYQYELDKLKGEEKRQAEATNVAMSVLADHARAAAFLIADGVLPANDGRGYVLRRIMRRAIRYGRNLSEDKSLYPAVVEEVIKTMSDPYSELTQQKGLITNTVKDEESRFLTTLDQGTQILRDELQKLSGRGRNTIPGDVAFRLYDTYGFPVDLTRLMAAEQSFTVDELNFQQRMKDAREKAKASWKAKSISSDAAHLIKFSQDILTKNGATQFTGYNDGVKETGHILALSDGQKVISQLKTGETGILVFDKTCFYAESGGQVGDTGTIEGPGGVADVLDCTKQNNIHLLHVKVTSGHFSSNDKCAQLVDERARRQTAANHSATHLLHAALRKTLGEHVTQAGSLVESRRLRFDFTHNKPLNADELQEIESLVNEQISLARPVTTKLMSFDDAVGSGALALFGEKYGDEVRVLDMGPFSVELCGGTHVNNTAMIRLFKIVGESGVSAGIRRVEAITSDMAARFLFQNANESLKTKDLVGLSQNWSKYIEEENSPLCDWAESTRAEIKTLQKEVQKLKGNQVSVESLIADAESFDASGIEAQLILADLEMDDRQLLSEISDKLRDKIKSGVVVIVGKGDDSHPIIVSVSKNLTKTVSAGQLLRSIAEKMGGKGGGRPDFAQGAVKDRSHIQSAFDLARSTLQVRRYPVPF
ncbi:MAG: alanine--tRNA ligase [Pseudobdellovibrionaceae bacterium]|nr:alanine--tRNA ligase [Bdellovibrionales bacterium]USN46505.1 MAG: alanine--tRNA ligase [Pseudobdellovibrionaceae bacterium]